MNKVMSNDIALHKTISFTKNKEEKTNLIFNLKFLYSKFYTEFVALPKKYKEKGKAISFLRSTSLLISRNVTLEFLI